MLFFSFLGKKNVMFSFGQPDNGMFCCLVDFCWLLFSFATSFLSCSKTMPTIVSVWLFPPTLHMLESVHLVLIEDDQPLGSDPCWFQQKHWKLHIESIQRNCGKTGGTLFELPHLPTGNMNRSVSHTFVVLLLFFMCESSVKRESILSLWMHKLSNISNSRKCESAFTEGHCEANLDIFTHISYSAWESRRTAWNHDVTARMLIASWKLLLHKKWKHWTGVPRSTTSTYLCQLPSRCTVLPATVAAASAN